MTGKTDPTRPDLPSLAPRRPDSHKGDYGRALLVGGSRGMAGAIGLSGMAALRSGAGLVTVAVPDVCQATVAGYEPCYMTVGLPSDAAGRIASGAEATVVTLAAAATVVALGPGLGRSAALDQLVGSLYQNLTQTMVVDADALNALAGNRALLPAPGGPRILTPHPGEFARLMGGQPPAGTKPRQWAMELAGHCGVVVVLKGHRTLVTDGTMATEGTTGNPGMATGGSGDVLTGVITALVCQGMTPVDAAQLAVHVHGRAGDLAAAQLGQVGMIARDLLLHLPQALREV